MKELLFSRTKTTRFFIGFPVRPSQGVREIFIFGDENPTRKKQSRRGKAVSGKGSEQPETKRRNGNTARTKNTKPVPEAEKAEAGNKKAERKHGTDKKRETGIRSGKAEAGNKTGYGTAQSGRRGKSRGVRSAEPNEKTGGFKKRSRRLTGHSCGRPLPASASGTPCFRRQTKRAFTERQASDPVNRMNMQQTSIFYTILLKNR